MINIIFPKIHSEGYKFIAISIIATIFLLIISKFCLIANENRKFKSKFKSIVSEKKNLIELCNKRYKNVKSFLTKSERNYYKNNLKKIVRSKMNSIR